MEFLWSGLWTICIRIQNQTTIYRNQICMKSDISGSQTSVCKYLNVQIHMHQSLHRKLESGPCAVHEQERVPLRQCQAEERRAKSRQNFI